MVNDAPGDAPPVPTIGAVSERLMAVAAHQFRLKGYAATTTRQLAEALGIRNASLYHHIGTKEELLYRLCVGALEHIYREVNTAVTAPAGPLERVRAMIRSHLVAALTDQDAHATMLIELRSLTDQRRQAVQKLRDDYEDLVCGVLVEAQSDGAIRSDLSGRQLTLALLNLLNWSIFWYRRTGESSPNELADLLMTIFLDGAVPGRPPVGG